MMQAKGRIIGMAEELHVNQEALDNGDSLQLLRSFRSTMVQPMVHVDPDLPSACSDPQLLFHRDRLKIELVKLIFRNIILKQNAITILLDQNKSI